jgi:hypothetical protein
MDAVPVERRLPTRKFLIGEQIPLTRFLTGDDAGAGGEDDRSLTM